MTETSRDLRKESNNTNKASGVLIGECEPLDSLDDDDDDDDDEADNVLMENANKMTF